MGVKLKALPVKKTNKSRDYVRLEISKNRGLSINPDIHHSKGFSSGI